MKEDNNFNLYKFNKICMSQFKEFEELDNYIDKIIKKIYKTKNNKKESYWMLLCKERSDYTVFVTKNRDNAASEIKETLCNRGLVIDIDLAPDSKYVYEIWIRDKETQENFVYYLFDYNNGVVEI